MTDRDLPQYATPWTKDGVMWCVTPICVTPICVTPIGEAHPYRRVKVWKLSESIAFWVVWDDYEDAAILHPDLLAGLGREVPPIPTPKTRATAVPVDGIGNEYQEYAVKGKILYWRFHRGHWKKSSDIPPQFDHLAAATRAFDFALAGELLPGESDE